MFASLAAEDGGERPMRPVHDIESLAYTLAYLAASSLPWQGKPAALVVSMKRALLTSSDAAAALTDGVPCATSAAALQALWAEVRRCHTNARPRPSVDYEACLVALGGASWSEVEAEADALSETAFAAALTSDGGSSEAQEAENSAARERPAAAPLGKLGGMVGRVVPTLQDTREDGFSDASDSASEGESDGRLESESVVVGLDVGPPPPDGFEWGITV